MFRSNWISALAAGMSIGPYHYFHVTKDAAE